jgi:alkylation response protein AidB-like acyl-CoA dehydrogenase
MEKARSVEVELARAIAARGWIGVTVDPEYGGMGLGHLAKTIVIEEISRINGAMGAMVQASQLGTAKILHYGTEEQKCRWLPAVSAGTCLPTIAVTERDSGGHVLGMAATAVRDGDHYVLNGSKVFVGNSHIGDLHGTVVRTGLGSTGLSAFLVESDSPGFFLAEHEPAMGLAGFSFGELIFENCRVPAANLLGREGDGLKVAYSSSVLYGRPNLAAVSLGIHQAIVDETVEFTQRRLRHGRPLSEMPTVAQKLGQLQSDLMTARISLYHAVHMLDQGLPCDAELMNAKLVNVELSLNAARTAMEVQAAHGLAGGRKLERLLRDAHHIYAPAGTSDIQRLRLAEVALGDTKRQWSECLSDRLRSSSAALRTTTAAGGYRRR